jgi:hypothetical protein
LGSFIRGGRCETWKHTWKHFGVSLMRRCEACEGVSVLKKLWYLTYEVLVKKVRIRGPSHSGEVGAARKRKCDILPTDTEKGL